MSKSGFTATIAFYGPNDQIATKAVVGIFAKDKKLEGMRTWFSAANDVREDETIRREMVEFMKENKVVHATAGDGIMGCPHEEGIDHAVGMACPLCDFWKGRDRLGGQGGPTSFKGS